jgi:hypothetical protein
MSRLFYLIAACFLVLPGCAKRDVAVPSTMTSAEKQALEDRLRKLDEVLRDRSPFILDKLAPAATATDLGKLWAEIGGVKVDSLEVWYRWHNGCNGLTQILPLGQTLSISEALADRKMMMDTPFVDSMRRRSLKILDDGAGDGFFVDIALASPRVFYHMLEDPFPRDYGTLQQFVSFVTDVHKAGVATEGENGKVEFDLSRYEKLEAEYLKRMANP